MEALEIQKMQSEVARKEIRCCDEMNQQYGLTLTDEDITDLLVYLALHGIAEGSTTSIRRDLSMEHALTDRTYENRQSLMRGCLHRLSHVLRMIL